jgi:predicted transposase/invertase (TIGR01784 family)
MANGPFLAVLAGCSARCPERDVACHISEGQRSNAPVSADEKWDIGYFRIPYVSDDLRDREDDIIWRIRMRAQTPSEAPAQGEDKTETAGEWLYVYLLLEFQSSNDTYMAVRILTYIGLLYQDLIKSGQTSARKLPAVFPLVLYNGERPWSAARELEELIEPVPPSLGAYRPRLRYFVMDEGRVPEASLHQADNAIASLVQLERSTSPQQIADVVGQLVHKLRAPQNRELRRALTVWVRRLVLRRFVPEGEIMELEDLPEVHHMISERVESWTQQWLKQGMQQGMQQGKLEGKLEAEADMLRRLLIRRFGPLPSEVLAQINAASAQQIEAWFDRSVDASDLTQVFASH